MKIGNVEEYNGDRAKARLSLFPSYDLSVWKSRLLGCPQRYNCTSRQLLKIPAPHIVERGRKWEKGYIIDKRQWASGETKDVAGFEPTRAHQGHPKSGKTIQFCTTMTVRSLTARERSLHGNFATRTWFTWNESGDIPTFKTITAMSERLVGILIRSNIPKFR